MKPLQAFVASLARSRAQSHAAFAASRPAPCGSGAPAANPASEIRPEGGPPTAATIEYITIHPPVWCHGCGRILAAVGIRSGAQITALCPDCAAKAARPDLRAPHRQRLRELVEITRLLAWHIEDSASVYADRGMPESARVMRELAAAANSAIEALRINPLED
jgi:hypothetical protein